MDHYLLPCHIEITKFWSQDSDKKLVWVFKDNQEDLNYTIFDFE